MQVREGDGRTGGQRLRRMAALLSTCLPVYLSTSCAKIGPPPGGPPDVAAPVLIATVPDSIGVYPDFRGKAEFIFDETVSEGSQANFGSGTGDLERMILLSPGDKVPRVSWERSRITVEPRDGWRPNTVYRVELLPGVTDLRRNRDRRGEVLTFTTGAPLPTDTLSGIVLDWGARQVARQAMVEAVLLPDSLVYRTQTDSTGRFLLAPLPAGSYLVRSYLDQNKDRKIDGRESWDSLALRPAPAGSGVWWLAERDTLPPRVMQTTLRDSLTFELQISQPFDPAQRFDTTNLRLFRLPDSTPVPILSFRPKALDDTLVARAKAQADSIRADSARRAHPDTAHQAPTPAAPGQNPAAPGAPATSQGPGGRPSRVVVDSVVIRLLASRPTLADRFVVRTAVPLPPQTRYVIELLGVRSLNGFSAPARGGLEIPKPPPPPKARPDSTRTDSTRAGRAPADSTRPPPVPRFDAPRPPVAKP